MKSYIRNIYFSRSFHRLAGKTQLYSNYSNDHFHNRLTHTIEVNNIAHSIWEKIFPAHPSDIVTAIALGHDLGHTPFGHAGERALNDITYQKDLLKGIIVPGLTDKVIFKHNYYSAKVALSIDANGKRIDKVLAGIILHTNLDYGSKCSLSSEQKDSTVNFYLKNYPRAAKTIKWIYKNSVEAQVVALADEISQRLSDMHDLLLSKDYMINSSEIMKILPSKSIEFLDGFPDAFRIKKLIELLGKFYINGVSYCSSCNILKMDITQQNSMDYIKSVVDNRIKRSCVINRFDHNADKTVKTIFKKLYKNPRWIDLKMRDCIFNRVVLICKSYNDKSLVSHYFPKLTLDLNNIDEKEKVLLLRRIYKVVHSKEGQKSIGRENVFLKEINSEVVYSIVFYIANMTDRFALEKYRQVNSLKKFIKLVLTYI